LVDELAAELSQLGRDRFEQKYGRHFLVLSDPRLAEDVSMFVNTASRDAEELLDGRRSILDVRPLVPKKIQAQSQAVKLGRDKSCDVVIGHPRISSQHAELSFGGGLLLITDLGSKNGTRLNGVKVPARTPTAVDVGDNLAFGGVTATVWGIDDLYAAMA
jgi:FHA domain